MLTANTVCVFPQTFRLTFGNVHAVHSKSLLKQNTEYCVKARFKVTDEQNWGSTWSEWGEPVCWTNEQMRGKLTIFTFLTFAHNQKDDSHSLNSKVLKVISQRFFSCFAI